MADEKPLSGIRRKRGKDDRLRPGLFWDPCELKTPLSTISEDLAEISERDRSEEITEEVPAVVDRSEAITKEMPIKRLPIPPGSGEWE